MPQPTNRAGHDAQLMLSAKKKWRKLDGQNRLPEIIQGIEFRDGIKHEIKAA